MLSTRFVVDQPRDRSRLLHTVSVRTGEDVAVGVDYSPLNGSAGFVANWRLFRETDNAPAVIVGTSADRIGTTDGRAYYVTLSKELAPNLGVYVGALYAERPDEIRVPAGAYYRLDDSWSAQLSYDGKNLHPMATYAWDNHSLSLMMVGGKYPGLRWSMGL